ncbi:hypothetical protein CEE37_09410 [candidate division LCP-89 bacterium B3_LCP]|uniref:DUF3800 domain-containing protein n=1 Tax=candidate division LCP-89 bacterium B3_LCP TaxID=2012998 RepID=A0A532UY97_UNCL8|nr:MAG: hypothetical protein CEE37_09410 [candidate division LCP-89 bacterium B3_LCP]
MVWIELSISMLVFVDESRWQKPERTDFFATVAGVAIDENCYDDFCKRLLRLKEKFFKCTDIGKYPLKGRLLLNRRACESYRKCEFVRELFSLCRLQNITTFSATKYFTVSSEAEEAQAIGSGMGGSGLTLPGSSSQGNGFAQLLAIVLERVNSFMLEQHSGDLAKLVFKVQSDQHTSLLSSSFMRFMYQTPLGGGFKSIMGSPLFAPAEVNHGLQFADLSAYIINQHHGGRYQMREYFAELITMQFVSSFERDEFELRGMNLVE